MRIRIRDPGWVKNQDPASGIFLTRDGKIRIRDPEQNIPDSQHWNNGQWNGRKSFLCEKYRAVSRVNRFSGWREEDVRQVVASCDKQRFALKEDAATGLLLIRANQGHSIRDVVVDMEEIRCAADAPDKVIHGTSRGAWEAIREQGLSRMRRQHIHCAAGEPGDAGVISGMRKACQVFIYIDVAAALADGFKFYRSANNVILCPGNEAGILPPRYFAQVKDMKKNLVIFP